MPGTDLSSSRPQHRRSAVERVLRKMTVADREQLAEPFDRFATAAGEPVDDTLTLIWAPT